MKWRNKGHEYDQIGEMICSLNKKDTTFYIWGAGTFGVSFYELFHNEINIHGYIDSNPEKQGKEIGGVKVYSPDFLDKKDFFVLVSAGWTKEIYEKLESYGYKKGQNFLHIDDFTSLYHWYKDRKVYLSDITYQITERCSLRCKNCNSFIPKITNPQNIPFDITMKNFEQFFQYVDNVNVLGIVGGDAMMHPEFAQIIDELGRRYYPNKASHIEVYCNAVIIPSIETLQILKKYDVFYRFSDYRPYTEGRQKIEEIIALLEKYGIRYDHVKFEKWCDCGYPQMSNGICGEKDLTEFFDSCDRKSCHILVDGYVINCGMARSADKINYCNLDSTDIFDISYYDESKRIELIEYMLGYSEKGYLNYCRMCNGSYNVNTKLIEAGEQLGTKNENK